ncbi:hypothetical protein GIB67_022972 [Kingdonia uniflora]|uniref:Uncharacterized protein n=1 Tax=Kingdonia uniflora TaxID=39325 RepID=A0A7J7P2R7_9MAGN|nr:hypothetical protein GIB67_022972 [Kingdonia uniflora]
MAEPIHIDDKDIFENLQDLEPLMIDVTTCAQQLGGRYRVGSSSADIASVDQFRVAPRIVEVSDKEGGQYSDERLLVSGNYEFDKKDPGELLKRRTFYLALKEIEMNSEIQEQLYNIRRWFYGMIDNLVIDQEKVGALFQEAGLKKSRAKVAEVSVIDGKMFVRNKRAVELSLLLENPLLAGYTTDSVTTEKHSVFTKTLGKGKKKMAISQVVAPVLPPKRYSSKLKIEEGGKVETPIVVPHGRPLLVLTSMLLKKRADSEASKKKYVNKSEIEVQRTMDAYVSRTDVLEVEVDDYLVGAESLITFLSESHQNMSKIKKLLTEAKYRIVGGVLANQLVAYKNIKKDLTKEKEDLIEEKKKLNAKLNRYKLDAGKVQEVALRDARKVWETKVEEITAELAKEKDEALALLRTNFEKDVREHVNDAQRAMKVEHGKVWDKVKAEFMRDSLDAYKKVRANYGGQFVEMEQREDHYKALVIAGNLAFDNLDEEDEVRETPEVPSRTEVVNDFAMLNSDGLLPEEILDVLAPGGISKFDDVVSTPAELITCVMVPPQVRNGFVSGFIDPVEVTEETWLIAFIYAFNKRSSSSNALEDVILDCESWTFGQEGSGLFFVTWEDVGIEVVLSYFEHNDQRVIVRVLDMAGIAVLEGEFDDACDDFLELSMLRMLFSFRLFPLKEPERGCPDLLTSVLGRIPFISAIPGCADQQFLVSS